MKLNEYASTRNTWGGVNTPKTVQKSIPVDRIYDDGMWRSGNVYSQMWSVSDINYAMVSDGKKDEIQQVYGKLYAGVPSDCTIKMCIVSQRMDDLVFRRDVLYHRANDGHDDLRAEKNRQLAACASLVGNVLQSKYVIVSTQKSRVEDARDRLRQVQGHLVNILSELGSTVRSVDNSERLRILHNFFRVGEESRFEFDLDRCTKLGEDFRDFVAPDVIEFKRDHIDIDNRVAKCMSMSYFPQRIDDKLVTTLLQQVPYIILTMDFVPIETEDAYKTLADYRMKVDADKVRFNRKSVDNLDFTANVPQRTQEEENTLNQWQRDMTDNDQQMFLTLLTVTMHNKRSKIKQKRQSAMRRILLSNPRKYRTKCTEGFCLNGRPIKHLPAKRLRRRRPKTPLFQRKHKLHVKHGFAAKQSNSKPSRKKHRKRY